LLFGRFDDSLANSKGHAEHSLLLLTRVVYHFAYFSSKTVPGKASPAPLAVRTGAKKRYLALDPVPGRPELSRQP
jgi:hypothetical protein